MRVGDVVPVVPMEHLLRNEYKCSAPKRMVWAKLSEIRVKIIHSSNIYEPFHVSATITGTRTQL